MYNIILSVCCCHVIVYSYTLSICYSGQLFFDFDPDDLMNTYSLVVTCEINPTSSAEYCEVIARNDDVTIRGKLKFTISMYVYTYV